VEYLSREQRVCESLVFSVISLALLCRTWVSLPTLDNNNNVSKTESSHSWLLRSLVAVFSMELCYKIISGQLIWCLNPCHVITLLQIYLILAPRSSSPARYLYRLHIYWLTGPVLAILFPVTSTRTMPGEVTVYWLQHSLILITPAALSSKYQSSSSSSVSTWSMSSLSVFSLYHWLILQPIGLVTRVNLSNMLCPAQSDPFAGPHYRIIAMMYFTILLPLTGNIYNYFTQSTMQKKD